MCYPSLSTQAASEILYTKIQYTYTTVLQRIVYSLTVWLVYIMSVFVVSLLIHRRLASLL
jgi:hypothetical protein